MIASVTVRDALERSAARLAESGCETPRLDAEVLLAHILAASRAALVVGARDELGADAQARFEALVARRAAREPVAYITGVREFRRLPLAVDRRVLIPRPETELLVEVGLTLPDGARVADVGTGSGAVALALKDERPDLTVTGFDVSPAALAVARENARRLGLEVAFASADLLEGVDDPLDAVLANLPYVRRDGPELAPEIGVYEPSMALYGGDDGLALIRRLVGQLDAVELVALEVGFDQADAVEELLRGAKFDRVERRRDLAGHERVIVGRR